MGWGRSSSDFSSSYNERTSTIISGFGRDWGCAFAHAPPLQEFGDMLTMSITNRIQSRDDKRICACWCLALVAFVYCMCVSVSICVSLCARVSMHELPTRVRSHFTVISYNPEISGSRSCDLNTCSSGLSQICLLFYFIFGCWTLNTHVFKHSHARIHAFAHSRIRAFTHSRIHALKQIYVEFTNRSQHAP